MGPERIYRLTPAEYTSSVRSLLGSDALEPVLDPDREPITTLDAVRKWYNAADGAAEGMIAVQSHRTDPAKAENSRWKPGGYHRFRNIAVKELNK